MAAKKPLPQIPARIEQDLIDAMNIIRKQQGLTWHGLMRKIFLREIAKFKK